MKRELPSVLIDRFQRRIDYVRLSITDRCDFRCVYCMAEDMVFAPKPQVLTLEEIHQVALAFTQLGVSKIRLTGGEPLIRSNVMNLIHDLGQLPDLNELVITTNGSQLQRLSGQLRECGVRRINVSLDSLQSRKFRHITRHGNLDQVIAGIDAAIAAGFDSVRINAVILKGRNDDEVPDLVDFVRQEVAAGAEFQEAVIRAGAVRAKPIALTALAAMLGAFFILDDPIFNGLAVTLIFGILVSTLLTLVVIPVLYYAFAYRTQQ